MSFLGRFRGWLCPSPAELGQPERGCRQWRQPESPADASKAAVAGLAKAGGRLVPAKHLLNARALLPADRVAGIRVIRASIAGTGLWRNDRAENSHRVLRRRERDTADQVSSIARFALLSGPAGGHKHNTFNLHGPDRPSRRGVSLTMPLRV